MSKEPMNLVFEQLKLLRKDVHALKDGQDEVRSGLRDVKTTLSRARTDARATHLAIGLPGRTRRKTARRHPNGDWLCDRDRHAHPDCATSVDGPLEARRDAGKGEMIKLIIVMGNSHG